MSNSNIAKTLILVAMVVVIVSIIIAPTKVEEIKTIINDQGINNHKTEDNINNSSYKRPLKHQIPFKYKVGLVVLLCLGILYFIVSMKNEGIQYQNNTKEYLKNNEELHLKFNRIQYAKPVNKQVYESEAKLATQRELEKLQNNPKYLSLLKERGNDLSKYNWQTAEKESKTVWRDEESDKSEDDLSKI